MKSIASTRVALFALGIVAAAFLTTAPSAANAATYTWTGNGANNNWFTPATSILTSNWNAPGSTLGAGDTAVFATSGRNTPTQNTGSTLTGVVFTGSTAYTINSASQNLTITGSLVNSSSVKQTFGTTATSQLIFSGSSSINTGTAGIEVGRTFNMATTSNLTKSGSGILNLTGDVTSGGANSSLTIAQGSIVSAKAMSMGPVSVRVQNGATLSSTSSGNSFAALDVATGANVVLGSTTVSGSFVTAASSTTSIGNGGSAGDSVLNGVLTISPLSTGPQTSFGTLTLGTSSNLVLEFTGTNQDTAFQDTIAPASIAYGGQLTLGLLNNGSDGLIEDFTSWLMFDVTSAASVTGSFSGVTLTGTNPFYSSLNNSPWTLATNATSPYDQKYGAGVWLSDWTSNNQRFIFNQANGTLTVVPEPSTIVFAGIGVAMLGWHTWTRRRRLAQMRIVEEHMQRAREHRTVSGTTA